MRTAFVCLTAFMFLAAQAPYPPTALASRASACSGMACCASGKTCASSGSCASHTATAASISDAGFCFRAAACGHQAPGAVVPTLDPASVVAKTPVLAIRGYESLSIPMSSAPPSFIRDPISPPPRA
jgi:hypothetical protein